MNFNKYLAITKIEMSRQLQHRFQVASYRVGNLIEVIIPLIIWTVAFRSAGVIKGYTYDEMITYVVVGWLILYLTASYGFERVLALLIYDGALSQFITKPISFLRYAFTLGFSRSLLAIFLSLIIQAGVIFIAREHIVFRAGLLDGLILILMVALAVVIRLFYSILISLAAFWTDEISGVDFTASSIIKFFSGAFFPVNILPAFFMNLSLATPFIYTYYFPVQIVLGKVSTVSAVKGLAVELLWIFIMYAIIKIVWRAGLRKYESVGI
ncbi:MAG: ABC-2 family transporter protein [Patescibacteria group bacterium]|jgi:ABC-2 type transport system permease protein